MKHFYKTITTRLFVLFALFMGAPGLQAHSENLLVHGDFTGSYTCWLPSCYDVNYFDMDAPGPKTASPVYRGSAGSDAYTADAASTDNSLDFLMDDYKSVTANFDPANVLVKLVNSNDVGMYGGVVEYYDRGWQNAGMTDDNGELRFNYEGRRSRLNFRLTYNGKTMTQNNVDYLTGPVVFQLTGVIIRLLASNGEGLPGGFVEVYNGSWTELGTTDADGKVSAGLPPGYYSIRMTYEGMTETKSNVNVSSPVVFQTVNTIVRLEYGSLGGIPDGEVMFQTPSMAWKAFGTTGNDGNASKELLPGVYDFSMSFQASTAETAGVDISVTNPLVFEPAPGSELAFITESKIPNPDRINNSFAYELTSIGISDEFAIVGAQRDKGPYATSYYNIGTAYIFRKVAGDWKYQAKLYANDWRNYSDQFGYSVDIDGNYAVVGAATNNNKGAVYVFFWNGISWVQQIKITPPNTYSGDYFGNSVAISGDQIIVGQYLYSGNRGAVHFYKRTGSIWSLEQSIYGSSNQSLGIDVDISGDRAVVGTRTDAYFYEKTTNWTQVKAVYKGSDFGFSVAISGDYAVVGAKLAGNYQGRAYVFYRGSGDWVEQAELVSPNPYYNERFGQDVDIWGEKVIVGNMAYFSSVDKEGAAYLFNRKGTNWVFDQKFRANDGTANNHFGRAVAISENDALVGATGADFTYGAAYFYFYATVIVPDATPKSGEIASTESVLNTEFSLSDNYPNPFTSTTKIGFTVKEEGKTDLKVYNTYGKEVAVLYSGEAKPGIPYEFSFDGSQLPAGLYIYRLQNRSQSVSKKMLLRK